MQTHGLVGCGEDAEEGEHDAAVPGGADEPGLCDVVGEDVGPGAGGGEDAGEEGGLRCVRGDGEKVMYEENERSDGLKRAKRWSLIREFQQQGYVLPRVNGPHK